MKPIPYNREQLGGIFQLLIVNIILFIVAICVGISIYRSDEITDGEIIFAIVIFICPCIFFSALVIVVKDYINGVKK